MKDFTQSWADGRAFCALIHNFFPNAFDFKSLKTESPADRKKNFELAFITGEKFAGVPDFLTAEDMSGMVEERRIKIRRTIRIQKKYYWTLKRKLEIVGFCYLLLAPTVKV